MTDAEMLLEAQREVDALTPGSPPIYPTARAVGADRMLGKLAQLAARSGGHVDLATKELVMGSGLRVPIEAFLLRGPGAGS